MEMADEIIAVLRLFERQASDPETHAWVMALAADRSRWPDAHSMFREVRRRWLSTSNPLRQGQYSFEEICLKTFYNQTGPDDPFNFDAPYHVVPCALGRAWQLGVPIRKILEIVVSLVVARELAPPTAPADI